MYRALHIIGPLFVILFLAHDWWSQTLHPRQMSTSTQEMFYKDSLQQSETKGQAEGTEEH